MAISVIRSAITICARSPLFYSRPWWRTMRRQRYGGENMALIVPAEDTRGVVERTEDHSFGGIISGQYYTARCSSLVAIQVD